MKRLVFITVLIFMSCATNNSFTLKKYNCDDRLIGKWKVVSSYSTFLHIRNQNKIDKNIHYVFEERNVFINGERKFYWFSNDCKQIAFGDNEFGGYRRFLIDSNQMLRISSGQHVIILRKVLE